MGLNADQEKTLRASILLALKSLEGKMDYFGKIIAQKAFYFLNEVYEADLPISFSFYHYGPYSSDLQHQLDKLELYGVISVNRDPNRVGFSYSLTDRASEVISDHQPESSLIEKIEKATEFVREKTPTELELLSTIHFAYKVHQPSDKDALMEIVRYLKPKFPPEDIHERIQMLEEEGMIQENL